MATTPTWTSARKVSRSGFDIVSGEVMGRSYVLVNAREARAVTRWPGGRWRRSARRGVFPKTYDPFSGAASGRRSTRGQRGFVRGTARRGDGRRYGDGP